MIKYMLVFFIFSLRALADSTPALEGTIKYYNFLLDNFKYNCNNNETLVTSYAVTEGEGSCRDRYQGGPGSVCDKTRQDAKDKLPNSGAGCREARDVFNNTPICAPVAEGCSAFFFMCCPKATNNPAENINEEMDFSDNTDTLR